MTPLAPPPRLAHDRIALFADLDGTLAPIAETPDAIGPDARRRALLSALSQALGGRVAVVSGRTLDDVDRILEGGVTAVAAVHGLVRRSARGVVTRSRRDRRLEQARRAIQPLASADPRLLIEDKDLGLALHFRRAPEKADHCRALAARLAASLGLALQEGDMVSELRVPGPDKGDAVRAFMTEAPFAGAMPVFVGDDLTDEAGFSAAAALGGFGVVVAPRRDTAARYALADVGAAAEWLAGLLPSSLIAAQ